MKHKKHIYIYIYIFIFLTLTGFFIFSCSHLKEARTAYQNNAYKTAISLCREAIAKDSTDTAAYILLIQSYKAADSTHQARAFITRGMNHLNQNISFRNEAYKTLIELGDDSFMNERHRQAESDYLKAERITPSDTAAYMRLANIYIKLGLLGQAEKKLAEAYDLAGGAPSIAEKIQAVSERTDSSAYWTSKGKAAYNKSNYAAALQNLQKALQYKADSKNAQYYFYMAEGRIAFDDGRTVYQQGDIRRLWDSVEAFGKAAVANEKSAAPHFYMGLSYERIDRKEYANAITAYEKALALEPDGQYAAECKKRLEELKKMQRFWGK